jgi:hypothetical protein
MNMDKSTFKKLLRRTLLIPLGVAAVLAVTLIFAVQSFVQRAEGVEHTDREIDLGTDAGLVEFPRLSSFGGSSCIVRVARHHGQRLRFELEHDTRPAAAGCWGHEAGLDYGVSWNP